MKKVIIALALTLIFSCIFVMGISARELYLEEIPEDLKIEGDTVTHFLVIEGEEYYSGSGATVNLFNMDKIAEELAKAEGEGGALKALGYTASDLGTKYLTKLIIPATLNGTTVTNVDINNSGAFKKQTYFQNCGYLEYPSSAKTTNDGNDCNKKIRCIDFGEDSQLTVIPFCYMQNAKNLIRLKNLPKNLETIKDSAFRGCNLLQGDENGQLYISAKTIEKKAFDNAMQYVESIVFGENVKTLATESFSNGEVGDPRVKYIEFKCDVTAVSFPNCNSGANTGAFYFGANSSQRKPYSSLACIILSNPAQAGCEGKTFCEVSGQNVYFNEVGGLDDFVYTSHAIESQNSCLESCTRCALTQLKENPQHSLDVTIVYENGFDAIGKKTVNCTSEGCSYSKTEEAPVLFKNLGYSAAEYGDGGISIGFKADNEAIKEYEAATGITVNYGVFAVKKDRIGNSDIFDADGKSQAGVIAADITESGFDIFNLRIVGFTDEQKEIEFAMGAFVGTTVNGTTEYAYLQISAPAADAKYFFASYNKVLTLVPSDDEENV